MENAELLALSIVLSVLFPFEDSVTASALVAGMGSGIIFEKRGVGFKITTRIATRALAIFMGTAGTFLIWAGLKQILPDELIFRYKGTAGFKILPRYF